MEKKQLLLIKGRMWEDFSSLNVVCASRSVKTQRSASLYVASCPLSVMFAV